MQKIWLKNYPSGVPEEINPAQFQSLAELIGTSCAQFAELPAYSGLGTTLSYAQYARRSRNFAAWLQQHAKMKQGDRIAIMLPNVLQYPVALYGALLAGLTIVNTNPLYTARELAHQLVDSGATAIVVLENFVHTLQAIIGATRLRTVIVTGIGDQLAWPKSAAVNFVVRHVRRQVPRWHIPDALRFNAVLEQGRYATLAPVELRHEDIAFLQYTGGTTGVAKAAMLTHRNMIANVLQSAAWFGNEVKPGADIVITALPLYHIFALTANCLTFVKLGAHNILIVDPRDFTAFVSELSKVRFTFISGVNTLFNALLNTPGFAAVDFSALRVTLGGGMAVQRAIAEQWQRVTGNVLTQAWGLTETSPAACINPLAPHPFNGSIGLPLSSTEISIRNDAGDELEPGAVGEICVRGPQVMAGYWNNPEETAKTMLHGGWLRTGDIGRIDEQGYVFIEDRKKDMILVSGFNVYPNEVESVAVTHPGVLEVAAVAQPDAHSGEAVALFVVRKDPNLTAQQVIDHCREQLTGYKIPRHVYFKEALPKTNVGKIQRRTLRDELRKT